MPWVAGFEPATNGLRVRYSTNELYPGYKKGADFAYQSTP